MNDELRELYQEVILDHNRRPSNFGPLPQATERAVGRNPLCGDHLSLALRINNEVIEEVRFEGQGCAISKASASLMTEAVQGKTVAEANCLFEQFHALVTSQQEFSEDELSQMGKLAAFAGVRDYPARVKCASLAWHTLQQALHHSSEPATTE